MGYSNSHLHPDVLMALGYLLIMWFLCCMHYAVKVNVQCLTLNSRAQELFRTELSAPHIMFRVLKHSQSVWQHLLAYNSEWPSFGEFVSPIIIQIHPSQSCWCLGRWGSGLREAGDLASWACTTNGKLL